MKFNVGDRVRIVKAPIIPELLGEETTVTSKEYVYKGGWGYDLELRHNGDKLIAPGNALVLIYDGHETCSWENSAWRPKEVVLDTA